MKRLLFFFVLSFPASKLIAQANERVHFFAKVGWTIELPEEFQVLDSTTNAAKNRDGKKAIEDATEIQADLSQTETLISAIKGQFNYFNATITNFDEEKDGKWEVSNQLVKDVLYKTFAAKMPDGKIDSASSTAQIGGLDFDQFRITVSLDGKEIFTTRLLSRLYRGYDFAISYLFLDDLTRQQVETMLRKSTFKER